MSTVIEVKCLSKSYTISHEGRERYTALRDVMAKKAKQVFSFPKSLRYEKTNTKEEFWALKDVNFNIEKGDRVGIIGRNGAGKSTLLKILSRIVEPTNGNIKIKGRIASLLEVGTGFHPELTGRENIFLNGAILGMSRADIKKHFEDIVEFAEVEKFLDTPVKRYSSGMYVRLAFAVAAHLEPEILIVDEVLAVGDAQFQKKCLGKMGEVSKGEGRTVLFVSHNMLAIKSLCPTGILLNNGMVEKFGNIDSVISAYASESFLSSFKKIRKSVRGFTLESISINNNGIEGNFDIDKDLYITVKVNSDKIFKLININLFFNSIEGNLIFATCSIPQKVDLGTYSYTCCIPANTLNDNIYFIDIMVVENAEKPLLEVKEVLHLEGVEPKRVGGWLGKFPGLIRPLYFKWERKFIENDDI